MKYRSIIITVGVLILVEHYLRFPSSWDGAIYAILGLAVIALAYFGGKSAGPVI